ncbi:MAG: tryptophan-rich sensory protein [Candidatus Levybacteria bacterium]|nr:tryptophan-rich sensory protein [Candidatus Levybacteria bacterium]
MQDGWNWKPWYEVLAKPSWTPSGEIIAVIWWILYPIIIISYSYVFYRTFFAQRRIPKHVTLPFAINLVANLMFIVLFFGAKDLLLSTLDIIIAFLTIPWSMFTIWQYNKLIALVLTPYLVWVFIATMLQISIMVMNP